MTATERHRPERAPRQRGEIPQFIPIETICRGVSGHSVEVVQIVDGPRRYHVTYEHGTLDSPQPSNYFFDTIGEVLNNHERVIQEKLGTLHRLPLGDTLFIAGEAQRMSDLSVRITSLAGSHIALATYDASGQLRDEIDAIRGELGNARNLYKVVAKQELGVASQAADPKIQLDALLAADLDIIHKDAEDLRIAQGTLARWRLVFDKRRKWEGAIGKAYDELGILLKKVREGNLTANVREQEARHISGQPEGLLAQLGRISGPEYFARIQEREVQQLVHFDDAIRAGNDRRAARILEAAISKLWRVVEERVKRERGEREK